MYFIKVRDDEDHEAFDYINVENIGSITVEDGVTLIYVTGDDPIFVAETPEELFQMIAELNMSKGVFVHNGLAPEENNKKVTIFTPTYE